jgi:hypothetical protein
LRDGARHASLVADVADDRQGLGSERLELVGGVVDRAGELRVGLVGLRDEGDVGAGAGKSSADLETDAAAGTRDERSPPEERVRAGSLGPSLRRPASVPAGSSSAPIRSASAATAENGLIMMKNSSTLPASFMWNEVTAIIRSVSLASTASRNSIVRLPSSISAVERAYSQ